MTTPSDTTPPDAPMHDLDADLQNLSTHEYPKPPYANHDQAMLPDPCALQPTTVRRAMEREGQMFKKMTHWIAGLKYLYWHEDTRTTELWYKSARGPTAGNDVHAFQRRLWSHGRLCTVRAQRGDDESSACGQLVVGDKREAREERVSSLKDSAS